MDNASEELPPQIKEVLDFLTTGKDLHRHQCRFCRHIWEHDGNSAGGNAEAHKCPQCNAGPFWERHYG